MESNASQKIMLFATPDRPYLWKLWKKLGNEYDTEPVALQALMLNHQFE